MTKKQHNLTAIIYDKRGRVLSIGKNSYVKTHPKQAEYARKYGEPSKIYLHAEVDALIRCRKIEKAHKIVIFRFSEDGSPANARPCCICASAIRKAGILNIEHT